MVADDVLLRTTLPPDPSTISNGPSTGIFSAETWYTGISVASTVSFRQEDLLKSVSEGTYTCYPAGESSPRIGKGTYCHWQLYIAF